MFLDITATSRQRDIILDVVSRTAEQVFIPLTVGGGIRTLEDFRRILKAGADKISINSAACATPSSSTRPPGASAASASWWPSTPRRGAGDGGWEVLHSTAAASIPASTPWSGPCEVERRGAGEILLTSMDTRRHEGRLRHRADQRRRAPVNIPVIASRRRGEAGAFLPTRCEQAGADAVLAASLFHYRELEIMDVKQYMQAAGYTGAPAGGSYADGQGRFERNQITTNRGSLPAVAQDVATGAVLMLAWMNAEILAKTLETGFAHYFSRSRQTLWYKGETSGHTQKVAEIAAGLRRRHDPAEGRAEGRGLPHETIHLLLQRPGRKPRRRLRLRALRHCSRNLKSSWTEGEPEGRLLYELPV